MARHGLTDDEWARIEHFFPSRRPGCGRPLSDQRTLVNGMMWVLRTGAPWRDIPEGLGKWQTVYHHFAKWRDDGTLERVQGNRSAWDGWYSFARAPILARMSGVACPECVLWTEVYDKKKQNRDEWREICSASDESELTNRAFAEAMGIKAGTLSYWRCKLRQEQNSVADFIEVESEAHEPSGGVVVDVGDVRVTMATLPPVRWLAELAASC